MPSSGTQPRSSAQRLLRSLTVEVPPARALRQGLHLPVCALRASLRALEGEVASRSEAGVLVRGALLEVDRLERGMRDLLELATPPRPEPLATTPREILSSALRQLAPDERARVRSSILETQDSRLEAPLHLDAPLLSSALLRVIENALEAGSEDVLVLLRLDPEAEDLTLSVLNAGGPALDPASATDLFSTTKPNRLGLGLALVQRSVELLCGTIEFESLPTDGTRVLLKVPRIAAETALPQREAA